MPVSYTYCTTCMYMYRKSIVSGTNTQAQCICSACWMVPLTVCIYNIILYVYIIHMYKIYHFAALNRRDLVAMALLLGCDYCPEGNVLLVCMYMYVLVHVYNYNLFLLEVVLASFFPHPICEF